MKTTPFTAGYTFVEMLVVLAIAALTLTSVTTAIVAFYRANSASLAQAYAVEGARQGIESAVAAIRGIQYGSDGSYPLSAVSSNDFTFYSDLNGDGIAEKVRFYLSGTDFKEDIYYSAGSPPAYGASPSMSKTLADSVRNGAEGVPIFHYYDAANAELASVDVNDPVAYVSAALIVNEDTASQQDYTLRSTAALRNVSQF